ncbi:MAG TPA: CDP-glucose 4,6-dehydratase [Rhizomicrobium sp.]|nr:CDP-glucose 4,6-dehydratase [Rhizomicrobium sp.]
MEKLGMNGFWRGRRVFLTGHTGFKGAWTALWLQAAGAEVTGFALAPEGDDNLYTSLSPAPCAHSVLADLRDADAVGGAIARARPEIVLHLGAQAIVRRAYRDPVESFATNVMGTVHVLDAAAKQPEARAILVVTSDKVYANDDSARAVREDDPLGGSDPYSASKSAAEMVAASWRKSFLSHDGAAALGVARAGNVIGGGDWGADRLLPDVIRAGRRGEAVALRSPQATRPWQHVLDVVAGYLAYAECLATGSAPAALNFGPMSDASFTVAQMVEALQAASGWKTGWPMQPGEHPPEKTFLSVDPSLAMATLNWSPRLDLRAGIALVAAWHRAYDNGVDMRAVSLKQIADYQAMAAPPGGVP